IVNGASKRIQCCGSRTMRLVKNQKASREHEQQETAMREESVLSQAKVDTEVSMAPTRIT
ncbi:hypothetical protein KIN20_009390, partial [Parelaphostrongylus tenuis]